jgi:chromosome segregation ATPase
MNRKHNKSKNIDLLGGGLNQQLNEINKIIEQFNNEFNELIKEINKKGNININSEITVLETMRQFSNTIGNNNKKIQELKNENQELKEERLKRENEQRYYRGELEEELRNEPEVEKQQKTNFSESDTERRRRVQRQTEEKVKREQEKKRSEEAYNDQFGERV